MEYRPQDALATISKVGNKPFGHPLVYKVGNIILLHAANRFQKELYVFVVVVE